MRKSVILCGSCASCTCGSVERLNLDIDSLVMERNHVSSHLAAMTHARDKYAKRHQRLLAAVKGIKQKEVLSSITPEALDAYLTAFGYHREPQNDTLYGHYVNRGKVVYVGLNQSYGDYHRCVEDALYGIAHNEGLTSIEVLSDLLPEMPLEVDSIVGVL